MFVFLKSDIDINDFEKNKELISNFDFRVFDFDNLKGFYILGNISKFYIENNLIGVYKTCEINSSYKFVSREFKNEDTVIDIDGIKIGGEHFQKIGGPCSFENETGFRNIAVTLKKIGVNIIRGGAFKPRTSPYFFQGIGKEAIKCMKKIADDVGVKIVSEIVSIEHIDLFNEYVDVIQVGTRNMYNYELLKQLGNLNKPILLKRGFSATIEEFLLSAEYIMSNGNMDIILCERGIRTFEKLTRNTLDISAVPLIRKISHLPIIIDPSHASGRSDIVEQLSLASVAAGCNGIMVEVHNTPETSLSDGQQAIKYDCFKNISDKIDKIREVLF